MRGWYRRNVGGLPATFWYLWSGLLINSLGGFGIIFLSLYLVKDRGLGPAQAGLVVGLYGVGGAAGVLTGGVLADRWSRRRTLLVSHTLTASLLLVLALVPWIPAISAAALLVGFGQSMVGPAVVAAMVDVLPPEDRTRAFSLEFWAFNLGAAIAAPAAGLLADAGFTPLFLVEAGATFVTLCVLALKVPETLPERTGHEPAGGLATVLADRPYTRFVGLTLVLAVLTNLTSTILPLSMAGDHLRPSAYGLVTGAAGLFIVAGQLFVPGLIRARSDPQILAAALAVAGTGTALAAFTHTIPAYLVAALVWTAGQMLAAPANAATIAGLASPLLRARYQAVFYLTFPLAGFAAPALGGLALQHLGHWSWLLWGALGLAGAAGHLAAAPGRQRRVAELRAAEVQDCSSAA